jgi:hypothetical protein
VFHARRSRWRILLASLVVAASTGIGGFACQGAPTGDDGVDLGSPLPAPGEPVEAGPTSHLPQCARYEHEDPDLYGYCIYKYAGGFETIEQINVQCGRAGKWEDDCRHSWVAGRMNKSSGVSMETLLEVCATNADCAFELLDFRPSNEVTVQISRCNDHAGKHAGNCIRHAMQRWYYTKPTANDVERIGALPTNHPDKVGYWLAAIVQCQGVGECPESEEVGAQCRSTVDNFSRVPKGCPAATKQPLPHNRGRPKHGGARPPKAPESSRQVPGSMPSNRPVQRPKGAKTKGNPPTTPTGGGRNR